MDDSVAAYHRLIESLVPWLDYSLSRMVVCNIKSSHIGKVDVRVQVVCDAGLGWMVMFMGLIVTMGVVVRHYGCR